MPPPSLVADRFRIEALAGQGGMGAVYRARDEKTGEPVAIKVLFAHGAPDHQRFAREAALLAELRHPRIVRYVAHGLAASGDAFLAMEWLEGEDLVARLARGPLDPSECVSLAIGVAEALAFAHTRNVVHRDIKPANLFLVGGEIPSVRVLDFGLARLAGEAHALTRTGAMIGTPVYMPPEQARATRAIDARADVYSLGCVLFECLTGRTPFVADSVLGVLAKILFEEPPSVSELRPHLPARLDALVNSMLTKDPDRRPADGSSVLRTLESLGEVARASLAGHGPIASLTTDERRIVSVVLARRSGEHSIHHDATVVSDGAAPPDATASVDAPAIDREMWRKRAAAFGGTLELLADGSIVVTLSGAGTATDQSIRAARCALALHAQLPSTPISLATARSAGSARGIVGAGIDAAIELLSNEEGPWHGVRIDAVTGGLLGGRFEVHEDDGKSWLVREHGVLRDARTLLGRPTPFVGRDRELLVLTSLLDECVTDGVSRVVVVTGAAGVGKSRLASEFLARVQQQVADCEVWFARGDPMSAGSPFVMLGPALRRAAGIGESESPASVREKFATRMGANLRESERSRVAEFLGEMAGIPFDDAGSPQLRAARRDAVLLADQTQRAWEDFVAAECAAHPVVLVLEDLQWGDLPSVRFLDAALRQTRERPLMIVAFARPEVHQVFPSLWHDRGAQEVRLSELSRRACERLARQALGRDASDAAIAGIVDRSGGNAFFLEELVRGIAGGHGDALPETVLAMVQTRLEGFDPDARRILRAASVFGTAFHTAGVAALVQRSEADVLHRLESLVGLELLTPRVGVESGWAFRNESIRAAAYAMLTERDRAVGHGLAGAFLEGSGERDARVIAEHFERGGEAARAIRWYHRAAQQALAANDLGAAVAWVERGLALGAEGEVRGELRRVEAEARRWRGEFTKLAEAAREALALLPRGSTGALDALGEAAAAASKLGDVERIRTMARELADLRASLPVTSSLVTAEGRLATYLLFAGLRDDASPMLTLAEQDLATLGRDDLVTVSRIELARAIRSLYEGDLAAALTMMEHSSALLRECGDLRGAAVQGVNVSAVWLDAGGYEQALERLQSVLAIAERLALDNVAGFARAHIAVALGGLGRLDEAIAAAREASARLGSQRDGRLAAGAFATLAMLLCDAKAFDEAERVARQSIEVAGPHPSRIRSLGTLGAVLVASGRVAEALEPARESYTRLLEVGSIDDGESLVRLTYAQALDALGDRAAARDVIATAHARLLERASKIQDPSIRNSMLRRVRENAQIADLAKAWGVATFAG